MGTIIELQKAVYRKILFSHLKKIKNSLHIEEVIASMEKIDGENIIIGLKKTPNGVSTDIYLFSSPKNRDILVGSSIALPFFPWNKIQSRDWNCINYEFSEEGEFTGTKIYIDNFSYRFDSESNLVPVAYFSEYSSPHPPNSIYINKDFPYLFVNSDELVEKTIGLKILKKRNALYFNNLKYSSFIDCLEKWFSHDEIEINYIKRFEEYLIETRNYHVCYDIFFENGENKIVNMGFFLKI